MSGVVYYRGRCVYVWRCMSVLNDVGDVFGGAILSGWEGVCWGVILVFCPPIFRRRFWSI